jgi:hypothetical protein
MPAVTGTRRAPPATAAICSSVNHAFAASDILVVDHDLRILRSIKSNPFLVEQGRKRRASSLKPYFVGGRGRLTDAVPMDSQYQSHDCKDA